MARYVRHSIQNQRGSSGGQSTCSSAMRMSPPKARLRRPTTVRLQVRIDFPASISSLAVR